MERIINAGKSGTVSRRTFLKLSGAAGITLAVAGLAGCSSGSSDSGSGEGTSAAQADVDFSNWDAVLEAARGQEVSWYGWGGDDMRNAWIEGTLAPQLKEKYDVTLNLVGMDINDILTQLSGEMQANPNANGTIDFVWINGENFASVKKNGYVWGPFVDYLPNYNDYVDGTSTDITIDFGNPTEGFEAPYGKAQMVFWVDGATVKDVPKNPDEFLEFCKAHPGQVSYPEPGDFTGTAFISCLIAGVIGKQEFEKLASINDATKDEVKAIIEPGLAYLRDLAPYLWKEGSTYPADSTTCSQMYADGELIFNMGYGDPQTDVDQGILPETTKAFVFESGTVGNTNFMAIPANAPHKAAALVAINEVISPELQLDQYVQLRQMSVLDMDKLPDDVKAGFDAVELGGSEVPLAEKLDVRVAEACGQVIPLIEDLWHEEVAGA
ncbi:ABC transporter substrate-binding protein [Adlercreutzia sp. ZJ141]|uniref:ABC transporter substrate-binding protein n=1 Tax=Adlercreutzia sp. ZJ141 TaxID=2709406 RepID=UPI0013EB4E5E|nr:ABC transporter substrate-binding protein [Adlercreutzia sp. ZJ141]